jgi:hypothetical protein
LFEPSLTGVKGHYLLFLQQIVGFYLSFNPENPGFINVALFYFGYTQKILIENKAIKKITNQDKAQLINYLKTT